MIGKHGKSLLMSQSMSGPDRIQDDEVMTICPQPPVSEVEESAIEVGHRFLGHVNLGGVEEVASSSTENDWQVPMKTTGRSVLFKVDTGANVTVIGQQHLPKFKVSQTDVRKRESRREDLPTNHYTVLDILRHIFLGVRKPHLKLFTYVSG